MSADAGAHLHPREVGASRATGYPEWHARVQLYLTVTDAVIVVATLLVVQLSWIGDGPGLQTD